jgi:hypothetical protein
VERRVTFVLRVTVDDAGRTTGVLELVRSGRKEPVRDFLVLGPAVLRLLDADLTQRGPPGPADPDS